MQTENANCESYCRRTLSSSWLSKINLRENSINYLRTLCKVRMRTANIIAEELWLSEINFKWFMINLSLHVQTENVNCTFYCWRTLITRDKFREFTIICLRMCELKTRTVHFIAEELWVSLVTLSKLDVHDVTVKSKHAVCSSSRLMTS